MGFVTLQHGVDRSASNAEVGKRSLCVHRREASAQVEGIPLTQRNVQLVAKPLDHVATRIGPSSFDETHVPCRYARSQRHVELRPASAFPP
jgi:hypothetical protein